MPLFSFEGRSPAISPSAWIAPTATIVGDVTIEAQASVWYGAVLRADFGPIIVRRGANIQDGSVLHGGADPVTEIGEGATVGHLCVVHGAVIGAEALIGNGATVLDGVKVGDRALVAAGCTVPPGMTIPDDMLAVGVPARVVGEVAAGAKRWVQTNPQVYRDLAGRHAAGIRPLADGLSAQEGNMLGTSEIVAFAAATDLDRARSFYQGTLGLRLVEQNQFACVFDADGTMLRVTAVPKVAQPGYTVLGWRVGDIAQVVGELSAAGVQFTRYDGMDQDHNGVWTTPGGDKVAWFTDPDGNTLSLTQFS